MSKRPSKPTGSASYPKRKKTGRLPPFTPKRGAAKLQRQELKVFDTALAFNFDATGEVPATGQLCFVQTGDTLNNRDGAVIMVKSLQIRSRWLHAPAASATAAGTIYLYIVQDRQANGAAAAVADVLTSTDLGVALGNVPNQYRFKILRKIAMNVNAAAGATTAYNNTAGCIEEYIKFSPPLEIRYTASAGAITDLASNNIFLIAGAETNIDDQVTLAGTARLRFTG